MVQKWHFQFLNLMNMAFIWRKTVSDFVYKSIISQDIKEFLHLYKPEVVNKIA